jgi:uncharacterized protein YoxC
LKDNLDKELAEVDTNAKLQGAIFRKLAEDITFYSREQLKARINDLKQQLIANQNLAPAIKAAIQADIENMEGLLDETNKLGRTAARISADMNEIGSAFGELANALKDTNAGLADTLQTISDIASVGSNALDALSQFASGNIISGIASTIKTIVSVFQIGAKAKESERQAQAELEEFQTRVLTGEISINAEYRERARQQAEINRLRLEGMAAESRILRDQRKDINNQYEAILDQIQQESFVADKVTERYGGFLGIGRKTRTVEILESLAGKSFEELEKLFGTGQLTGKAKELFELLRQLKLEGADVDAALAENALAMKEAITGTTADAITDTIFQAFANGERAVQDFADNFEAIMRDAILQSFKYSALEKPLQEFYEQFAGAAQSDNILTEAEIQQLRSNFNRIMEEAGAKFDELQKVTDVDLIDDTENSLKGAIRGITEQQADLLAGTMGGLRLTAIEQLKTASVQLVSLRNIEGYTSFLPEVYAELHQMNTFGVKIVP